MTQNLANWLTEQLPEDRLHVLRHQPIYLAEIKDIKRLVDWLMDFGFLEQKLANVGIAAIIDDYDLALPLVSPGQQRVFQLIQKSLLMSSHILEENNDQLAEQLMGRLLYFSEEGIKGFIEQVKQYQQRSWFCPLFPCFDSPDGVLIRTLEGHEDSVNAVAITPDGRAGVSASGDTTLKLWNLKTGRVVRSLQGHTCRVLALAISPSGKRAVSGSYDNTIKMWDLRTGEELRSLVGHGDWVTAVAITPDGKRALSGSKDTTIRLWDLVTGEEIRTFTGHGDLVAAVAITPDGKRALSASFDKTLKLWDLQTGEELRSLVGHEGSVWAVAITPDGKRALSGSFDQTLKLWDLQTGKELRSFVGHE
ncbi:WD40 repeat domain-containing protein, partial [Limnoraphis robusta]|nr:WD40 repeat domain-containing protein [Limnoraphis robusta]